MALECHPWVAYFAPFDETAALHLCADLSSSAAPSFIDPMKRPVHHLHARLAAALPSFSAAATVWAALLLAALPAQASAAGQAAAASAALAPNGEAEQTLILIRHGEKPADGLGQLDCQGLNRALALPAVLLQKFGKPDFLFAPDPAQQIIDHNRAFSYIRPLATIEPSAVRFGMPVETPYGYLDIDKLRQLLDQPAYQNAHIVIAWEHRMAERLARALVQTYGGDPSSVPRWGSDDFDSIYIVKVSRTPTGIRATFTLDHEGLNGQSTVCPGPAPLAQ